MKHRFLLLSFVLVLCNFAIVGAWTASRLESAIRSEVGLRAAGMLEGILAPHAEQLAAGELTEETKAEIAREFAEVAPRLGLVELKVWGHEGQILYGSRPGMAGRSFPVEGLLAAALAGTLAVGVDERFHREHPPGQRIEGQTLFEIYAPIRPGPNGKVVAVGEFYQDADQTAHAIAQARWQTWGMVLAISLALIASLHVVVAQGDQVIVRQKQDLNARVMELTTLLDQNQTLQARIRAATRRSNEHFESQLRRIGADIHDSIGQLLTVALLRLDETPAPPTVAPTGAPSVAPTPAPTGRRPVRDILQQAMNEVRALTRGLSLPHVRDLALVDAIAAVVRNHEELTGTTAEIRVASALPEPGHAIKLGICRFVQEGLNNAFKHAGGKGQAVEVTFAPRWISVTVRDAGPGMTAQAIRQTRQTLGVDGLRNRVESLGGTFQISSAPGQGTEIVARFPIETEDFKC